MKTVDHFLFRCSHYQSIRNEMFNKLSTKYPKFCTLNEENKLQYILNLDCPATSIGLCCSFISKMYKKEKKITLYLK